MIADGWEYGQYQTDKCKQSHKLQRGKKVSKSVSMKISQSQIGCRKNQNKKTKETKRLDKNKQLTNEMIADGWEYGQYQTDKCKQSHEIRKVKIKLDGIEKTIDEWSNILGISKAKIKFRYKEGFKTISDIINPPTHIKSRNGG